MDQTSTKATTSAERGGNVIIKDKALYLYCGNSTVLTQALIDTKTMNLLTIGHIMCVQKSNGPTYALIQKVHNNNSEPNVDSSGN